MTALRETSREGTSREGEVAVFINADQQAQIQLIEKHLAPEEIERMVLAHRDSVSTIPAVVTTAIAGFREDLIKTVKKKGGLASTDYISVLAEGIVRRVFNDLGPIAV